MFIINIKYISIKFYCSQKNIYIDKKLNCIGEKKDS